MLSVTIKSILLRVVILNVVAPSEYVLLVNKAKAKDSYIFGFFLLRHFLAFS